MIEGRGKGMVNRKTGDMAPGLGFGTSVTNRPRYSIGIREVRPLSKFGNVIEETNHMLREPHRVGYISDFIFGREICRLRPPGQVTGPKIRSVVDGRIGMAG